MPKGVYPHKRKPIEQRFWAKVEKTENCWLWKGAIQKNGYGKFGTNGHNTKNVLAHRMAWVFTYGPIPDGIDVLHKCDNHPCVKPDHLFLGTQTDNMQDMIRKGRRDNHAKLTVEEVIQIKGKLKGYIPGLFRKLAKEFGISNGTISAIYRGKIWKNIKEGETK